MTILSLFFIENEKKVLLIAIIYEKLLLGVFVFEVIRW